MKREPMSHPVGSMSLHQLANADPDALARNTAATFSKPRVNNMASSGVAWAPAVASGVVPAEARKPSDLMAAQHELSWQQGVPQLIANRGADGHVRGRILYLESGHSRPTPVA